VKTRVRYSSNVYQTLEYRNASVQRICAKSDSQASDGVIVSYFGYGHEEKNAMQITLFTNGNTNTKSVMKASISLVVAAMLLTAVLAVPAAAQKQVPFKGSLQGHETDTPEGGQNEIDESYLMLVKNFR
jgi:hypothetical protein